MVVEIKRQVCDGHMLKWLVAAGLSWLEHNHEQVNNMNVFPVPDGDTGTNMYHTMKRAYAEIANKDETHIGLMSEAVAHGALMGARGNSGTILSQLLSGFAEGLRASELMDAESFARACRKAVDMAYASVLDPVEGTILTVSREAAEAVIAAAERENDLKKLLYIMIDAARDSLKRTPELLPVLREAGVIDSGGLGFVFILEGMLRFVNGETVSNGGQVEVPAPHDEVEYAMADHDWRDALEPGDSEGWGYDVQFLMRGETLDVDRIRGDIDAMGWSTLVVGNSRLVKVHVHVKDPGEPLSYAIRQGAEIDDIVVENMQAQYQEYVQQRIKREAAPDKEVDGVAVIAVVNGEGLAKLFDDLHAARTIAGGQTMNPSTEDFLLMIESLPNDEIILLPNNKNIILAAKQAASLARGKQVFVLPSKTIPQGISALIAYGDLREDHSFERLCASMEEAMGGVVSCEVTTATRSVELDGVQVAEGQTIGLLNGKLVAADGDIVQVVRHLLARAHAEDYELATLYYGSGVSEQDAVALAGVLAEDFPGLEFEMYNGGQPLYPYIISVE